MAAVEGLTKIPELRRRILFTLGMLAAYRVGCHIPVPGINTDTLSRFFENNQNTLFGMLNMFSGKALENASIFALGIMPYISSSIIFQLLTSVWPYLNQLSKEGEMGRRKINQYTRYATIVLAMFQGFGIASALMSAEDAGFVLFPGIHFKILSVITLAAGTGFIMWLGEQITDRGIGNGISLIIFAGISAGIPVAGQQTLSLVRDGQLSPLLLVMLIGFMVCVVGVIIFLEQGQRRIPIQYAKRQVGRRLYGGQSTHLPLKLNTSGVIPPIFASSLLMAPLTVIAFLPENPVSNMIRDTIHRGGLVYYTFYTSLIVFFCFFYTAVVFNPADVAENLKKYGGYVPGIRPGKNTADYIDKVLSRITFGGAMYLSMICLLPDFLINRFKVSFFFGGTTLLILVGVALDTVSQIQTFLLTRDYEGFMKNASFVAGEGSVNITVFLGAPGSGKGTQAKRLVQEYGFQHFSTGDMLRAAIREGSALGLQAKACIDRGDLVPDDVMIGLIEDALKNLPGNTRVLLDGFPRTVPQAEALDRKTSTSVRCAIYFSVPETVLISRLTGRRVCEACGEPFHVEYRPPQQTGVCDRCGSKLIQRADDAESVVRHRLLVFSQQTAQLVEYYQSSEKLRELSADKPVEAIQSDLIHMLH